MDQAKITPLSDREAICDCLYRNCRGIDGGDETALRSSYWPDAHGNHGVYSGSAEGFIQLVLRESKRAPRTLHQITNVLIEFTSPAEASVESYFTALQCGTCNDGEISLLLFGRYSDLFQKREGQWRIAKRTTIYEGRNEQRPLLD
ncbi:nuclear transport factor 2 family protein [Sinorhizobium meliloti]|nr:nuclear transport factor 2 family protein [Sinorhizobium meliloti]MDX0315690.1 nuclear transport factor 2 family protein [Sinorhizobium meliloti]RVH06073.1 nuclear transport factor 2 family protein [Sinorhizobium meliloti]